MPIQTINLGNYANDGTGDDLRTAFQKVNANFELVGGTLGIIGGENVGSGTGIFKRRDNDNLTLEFKTLTSTDGSIEITSTDNTVNVKSLSTLENDPNPSLSGDLSLNGNNIIIGAVGGGDVQTTVFGIDVRTTNALIELLINSNSVTIDFGSFIDGTVGTIDAPNVDLNMNGVVADFLGFSVPDPSGTNLDFGSIV
jgi:hypothetical protein